MATRGGEKGEAAAVAASRAAVRAGNRSILSRDPRGTRVGLGSPLQCGGAERRRDANENGAGKAAESNHRCVEVQLEPPGRGRARARTVAGRGGLGPEGEAGRSRPGAAERDSGGRVRSRLSWAILPAAGGGPRPPRPGPAALREPLPPGRAIGNRSGARTRATPHAPQVNGRSCLAAPRALSRREPLAPVYPPPPPAPSGPGSAPGSRGSALTRGRSGPAQACAAAANTVSAHLTPNPPLGRGICASPARTRAMSSSGLSRPPRSRMSGSPLVSHCAGASTAASFATKPGSYCPSWGRAWERRGERAYPSAAETVATAGRGAAGSNPTAGTAGLRAAAGLFPAASRALR